MVVYRDTFTRPDSESATLLLEPVMEAVEMCVGGILMDSISKMVFLTVFQRSFSSSIIVVS